MLRHIKAFFIASGLFVVFVILFIVFGNLAASQYIKSRGIVEVPNIIGLSVDNATSLLNTYSLHIDVNESEHHEYPEGLITSQVPSHGRNIFKNRTIQVTVSRGQKVIAVPQLAGIPLQSVEEVLRIYELRRGNIVQHYSNTVPAGYIISSTPAAGINIMAGSAVNITLSIGRDPLEVTQESIDSYHFRFDSFFDEDFFF